MTYREIKAEQMRRAKNSKEIIRRYFALSKKPAANSEALERAFKLALHSLRLYHRRLTKGLIDGLQPAVTEPGPDEQP